MEVHAHTHTPRKKWTHYLWEFLMLFLAVFCGFLAEYQLEHMIEHSREKQYIESMVEDLKADSTRIDIVMKYDIQQVAGIDSLLRNIYNRPYTDSSLRMLYYLKENYTLVKYVVRFSKGTLSQLKNSGGLRLIRNRAAADSIIKYDIQTERIEGQAEGIDLSGQKLLDHSIRIFDGEYVLDYTGTSNYKDILRSNKKFTLLTNDEILIKEYANLAKFKKDVIVNYIAQVTALQRRIPGIIASLKKEYHLK